MPQEKVRQRTRFEEDLIERLTMSEEHRSALWLWARFSRRPEHSFPDHDELDRRLSAHGEPALRSIRHDKPALRP